MFFVIYVYLGKLCNWISNICRPDRSIREEVELTTIHKDSLKTRRPEDSSGDSGSNEPENDFIIVDLDEV